MAWRCTTSCRAASGTRSGRSREAARRGDAPVPGTKRFASRRRLSPPSDRRPRDRSMLTPEIIAATAQACLEMHRARARYRPLDASVRKAPLDDAYRIQDALHRLMIEAGRGEIAGWKIALTSKAMQQMTGVDQPAAGAIFSKVVHPSPARVDLAAYHHLGVEFEVAVRLGESLPARGGARARGPGGGRGGACLPPLRLGGGGAARPQTRDPRPP